MFWKSKKKEYVEFDNDSKLNSNIKSSFKLSKLVDGSFMADGWIGRNIGVFILGAIIGIFYISNRNITEKNIREIQNITKEIKELRAESISTSAELARISKQSEVEFLLKKNNIDLVASDEPPVVLGIE